MILFDLQDNF